MATKTPLINGDTFALPKADPITIRFAGTSLASEPVVTIPSFNYLNPTAVYEVNKISARGTAAHPVYGEVNVAPISTGFTIENGIHVSEGNVQLNRADGGIITLGGKSTVSHDSTVSVYGGRYQGDQLTFNNAKLTVSGNSTFDSHTSPLTGTGTIDIEHGSTLDTKGFTAGLHINDSGTLDFTYGALPYPGAQGPINLANNGDVHIGTGFGSPSTITSAVLHSATDFLDLLGPTAGAPPLMSLQFSGDPKLYVTPDGHGGMDITTHHKANSLQTMIVRS